MNGCILFSFLCLLIFSPVITEAAYRIFLFNGQVIRDVDDYIIENDVIKVFKSGITLELRKKNVITIEQYKKSETAKENFKLDTLPDGELPYYQRYKESFDRELPPPVTSPVREPSEDVTQKTSGDTESDDADITPRVYKKKGISTFIAPDGTIKPGPQLKELRRQEEEGTLPENFKPFKDFMEKEFEKQKEHLERK
jgi:hypothetical protein